MVLCNIDYIECRVVLCSTKQQISFNSSLLSAVIFSVAVVWVMFFEHENDIKF